MGRALGLILLILCLDVVLLIGNQAIKEINPNTQTDIFNCKGNILQYANAQDCDSENYTLRYFEKAGDLPATENQLNPTGVNIVVDSWQAIVNFFNTNPFTRGLGFLFQLPNALGSLLSSLNLPPLIVFSFGSIWFIINIYVLIAVIFFGRSD